MNCIAGSFIHSWGTDKPFKELTGQILNRISKFVAYFNFMQQNYTHFAPLRVQKKKKTALRGCCFQTDTIHLLYAKILGIQTQQIVRPEVKLF